MRQYYVYILASKRNGTLYTGVTNDLGQRTYQHKTEEVPGFTREYGVKRLVYYEVFRTIEAAVLREKRIKKWERQWKLRLIEQANPNWDDLFDKAYGRLPARDGTSDPSDSAPAQE